MRGYVTEESSDSSKRPCLLPSFLHGPHQSKRATAGRKATGVMDNPCCQHEWREGNSTEELPASNWPAGMSMGHFPF